MNDELLQISDATDRYPGNHPVAVTAIRLNERRLLSIFERCKNGSKVGVSRRSAPDVGFKRAEQSAGGGWEEGDRTCSYCLISLRGRPCNSISWPKPPTPETMISV